MLLDALDGGAFGAHHQPHHAVGHAYLDGYLSGDVRRGARGHGPVQVVLAARPNLAEVLGGGQDLALRHPDIFLAT